MKLYKDLSIGYCILAALGAILLLLLSQWVLPLELRNTLGVLIWFILTVIWSFGCAFFFQLLARKRLYQSYGLRNEECRIKDFLNVWEGFLNRNYHFISTRMGNYYGQMIRLNLSVAYLDMGENGKSLELLLAVPTEFSNNAGGTTHRLTYYNNLTAVYLRLHNLEQAEQNLTLMKKALERVKLQNNQYNTFYDAYQSQQMLLEMQKGNYEGAEEFFLERLKKESLKITQVYIYYYLADVYQHFGNTERERECLTFVSDNGGDSIYALNAKKRLE